MRKINAAGRELIRAWEGYRIKAYLDGGGVPTICIGHTGDVELGTIVTDEECERFFALDLEEHNIEPYLGDAPTNDNQYAAMTCLAFNIGLERFRNSTVLKRHKLGNRIGAANAFLWFKYDNGRVVRGLLRRREAERKLYLA
jgi:lysozyme